MLWPIDKGKDSNLIISQSSNCVYPSSSFFCFFFVTSYCCVAAIGSVVISVSVFGKFSVFLRWIVLFGFVNIYFVKSGLALAQRQAGANEWQQRNIVHVINKNIHKKWVYDKRKLCLIEFCAFIFSHEISLRIFFFFCGRVLCFSRNYAWKYIEWISQKCYWFGQRTYFIYPFHCAVLQKCFLHWFPVSIRLLLSRSKGYAHSNHSTRIRNVTHTIHG